MSNEEEYFSYSATLRIFSEVEFDFKEIERHLKVKPSYCHKKGDSKGSSSVHKYFMWQLESGLGEEEQLHDHLFALWSKLKQQKNYLLELKKVATIDIFCGYRSSCDHAGIEIDYKALEVFRELEIDFGLSVIIT